MISISITKKFFLILSLLLTGNLNNHFLNAKISDSIDSTRIMKLTINQYPTCSINNNFNDIAKKTNINFTLKNNSNKDIIVELQDESLNGLKLLVKSNLKNIPKLSSKQGQKTRFLIPINSTLELPLKTQPQDLTIFEADKIIGRDPILDVKPSSPNRKFKITPKPTTPTDKATTFYLKWDSKNLLTPDSTICYNKLANLSPNYIHALYEIIH